MTSPMTGPTLPDVSQPMYFAGQRLLPEDLAAGQDYHREMRRLHNRTLHAWGIALGLVVGGDDGAKQVSVGPGYALDHLGRELVLAEPVEVPVPPVAGDEAGAPVGYYLTISYVEDPDASRLEARAGVCATGGAVRLAERPRVRWQPVLSSGDADDPGYRPGLDVVLASATVAQCRLRGPVSLDQRRDARAETQPYVAGGATEAGNTGWARWRADDEPAGELLGVSTVVDTSSGRFRATPIYLAQVAGLRYFTSSEGSAAVYEGFIQVTDERPDGFVARVLLPEFMLGGHSFNPREGGDIPVERLRTDLFWHVVWTGVEG